MDAGEDVVLDEPIGQDDRVLVVAALPAHERDQDVAAERELAALGRAAVSDRLTGLDQLADLDDRALIDARALVAADELVEAVLVELVDAAVLGLDLDAV